MSTSALAFSAIFPPNLLPDSNRQWAFHLAIVVSVAIHAVALGWLPGLNEPSNALARPIQVRLALPAVEREPVAVSPAPTFAPSPRATRGDTSVAAPQAQPLLASPASDTVPEQYLIRSSEPPVVAPVQPARPNPVAAPVRSSAVDLGMLAAYGRELAGAVATRQRYPRIALLRQWQGTAVLQLELAADGQLLGVRVLSSSVMRLSTGKHWKWCTRLSRCPSCRAPWPAGR